MAHRLDHLLHDAEVVEDRHEAAEEDDRRQHLEGELHAEAGPGAALAGEEVLVLGQVAEQEPGAVVGEVEEGGHPLAERLEDDLAVHATGDQPGDAEDHEHRAEVRLRGAGEPEAGVDQQGHHEQEQQPAESAGGQQGARPADAQTDRSHHRGPSPVGALAVLAAQDVGDDQQPQHRHADEAPGVLAQDGQRQHELQAEAPEDRPQVHLAAVVGQGPGQAQ